MSTHWIWNRSDDSLRPCQYGEKPYYDDQLNRDVAKTEFTASSGGPTALVSTIFLIDHNHSDDGDPILFETMIFNCPQFEYVCERYTTPALARDGHERWCQAVRKHLGIEEPEPPPPSSVVHVIGGTRKIRIEPKRRT